MPVRGSMTDLIAKVSLMVGDPTNAIYTTQQVQDALDARRIPLKTEWLESVITLLNGSITYNDYYSHFGWCEGDATLFTGFTLIDLHYTPLTPSSVELLRDVDTQRHGAHFYFSSSQIPPVGLQGWSYDPYGTAADLLYGMTALQATQNVDFSADSTRVNLSQISTAREREAARLMRRARARKMVFRRQDAANPEGQHIHPEAGVVSENVPFITGP